VLIEAHAAAEPSLKKAILEPSEFITIAPRAESPAGTPTPEAEAVPVPAQPRPQPQPPAPPDARQAAHAITIPVPSPAMPSRSLPQPLSADGTPQPLPPLPADLNTPSSLPGSSEPCASPQGSGRMAPASPAVDADSTKAGFTKAPRDKDQDKDVDKDKP